MRACVRHSGYPSMVIITSNSSDHSMDLLYLVLKTKTKKKPKKQNKSLIKK